MKKLALTAWQLKQYGDGQIRDWTDARVPGSVQQTLLEADLIPDPFYGTNEKDVRWVGESDWLYRTTFRVSQEMLNEPHLDLCFDGLDTFATVYLNGERLLEANNMFVPYRVNVKDKLRAGNNELTLHFASAWRRGRDIEAERGKRPNWNGDSSRLYVRKAQYHYGWDWGPVLLCAGPWKDVYLEGYETRLADVLTSTRLENDFKTAVLDVVVTLEGTPNDLTLEFYSPEGKLISSATKLQHSFRVENPQLWYPHGYGPQPLYRLVVRIKDGDSKELKVGFRDIQIVQESVAGESGSSFFFKVNGLEMFVGGANWIPDDLMLNRISPEQYRERIKQAKDANMLMLRVWGGGIYEPDVFYDLCDELGIMVWQDFMFACGIYPAYPEFLESVRQEAEANVKRLRHHACLALWCGNNEDYQIAESVGQYGEKGDASKFEARAIYEKLLPEICERLDPTRFYWPGSPYGGPNSFDQTIGDRHTWEIWHGPMAPYQQYYKYEGRFVSEFGMQSHPSLACFEPVLPEQERFPQSRTIVHHNRAFTPGLGPDGHRRMAVYIADNLRDPVTLSGYVYSTQFIQAEAMRYAYSSFRRRWGVPGKRAVAGALVWQLNDCWPVTSWAIIDSSGFPKPAYYTIKRGLEPVTLGLWRTETGCDIWATNREENPREGVLELRAYNFEGKEIKNEKRQVMINPNSTTELGSWNVKEAMVVSARLLGKTSVTARAALWSEPFKYYELPNPELRVEAVNKTQLKLSVHKPAKGVWLNAVSSQAVCDDNFLDIMPGDDIIVALQEIPDELKVQWLGGNTLVRLEPATVVGD
jgi:beta-mannosidase